VNCAATRTDVFIQLIFYVQAKITSTTKATAQVNNLQQRALLKLLLGLLGLVWLVLLWLGLLLGLWLLLGLLLLGLLGLVTRGRFLCHRVTR
jgi:hypothetical protein